MVAGGGEAEGESRGSGREGKREGGEAEERVVVE